MCMWTKLVRPEWWVVPKAVQECLTRAPTLMVVHRQYGGAGATCVVGCRVWQRGGCLDGCGRDLFVCASNNRKACTCMIYDNRD